MVLVLHHAETDSIERPYQSGAREEFGRSHSGALGNCLIGHRSVLVSTGIAAINDDLPVHVLRVVTADLRHGAIWNGDQYVVTKLSGLGHTASAGVRACRRYQRRQLIQIAGSEQNLMPGLRPALANGAADLPGTDNADTQWFQTAAV